MTSSELLIEAYSRIREAVHDVLDGLDEELLTVRLDAVANTIAWLIWHLTRVQDDHIADVAGREELWTSAGWEGDFGLPALVTGVGYGHTSSQVAAVRAPGGRLLGYYDAVHDATVGFLTGLSDSDLDRIVDTRWDPPVTLGVRLASVLQDDLMHVGQAGYVRGILERR